MRDSIKRKVNLARGSIDLTLVAIAWVASYFLRFYTIFPTNLGIPQFELYFKLLPFVMIIWGLSFSFLGLYRRTGSHRSALLESLDLLQCSIFALGLFVSFSYFYEEYRYSRITLLIFGTLTPALLIAGRSCFRKYLRHYRRQRPERRILAIGSGPLFESIWKLKDENFMERGQVSLAIPVGSAPERAHAAAFAAANKARVLSIPDDWATFFTQEDIQAVFISLPQQETGFLETHLGGISDQVIDVKIIPDLARYIRLSSGLHWQQGVPVIDIHQSPLEGNGAILKRMFDVAAALAAILILSPVLLVISILIPFSSRGPILYRQERMGLDGKTFNCLKFRSMPIDAEKATGAVWAKEGDNRATKLGSFLRRTSLDELPQLFNVLFGDMSLVGPRPERPVFVNQFRHHVPGYMLRHKAKAGMTGWAQVNGWRGNTSIEKRIECDLYYIQNWSIWLDIKILFMTVEEVLVGHNAY